MNYKNVQDKEFYEKFWEDYEYKESYAFHVAIQDRYPAIKKVWGDLLRPKKVLDFGCGNGVLSYWLKSNGFGEEIVGVDISTTGIDQAIKMFGRDGLTFEPLDYIDRMNKNSVDVVVSSHVFEHIENAEDALMSIRDKAEWFVIEVPLENCLFQNMNYLLRGKKRKENPLGHVNFWTKDSFNSFIENSGLSVINSYQYASAPFSKYNHWVKRIIERLALRLLGIRLYGKIMASHYIVLAGVYSKKS